MLRPDFTQTIARDLSQGKSINIFGDEEHGLNQFVEDLKTLCPTDNKFIGVSMRSYADRYDGFINDIAGQLCIANNGDTAIELLINRFLDASRTTIWLCLEHFERLEKVNTDPQYNRAFLDYLNSLKNNGKVSLILTSAHKLATHELFIDGKAVSGSKLDLDYKPWTKLRLPEIEIFLSEKLSKKPSIKTFLTNSAVNNALLLSKIDKSSKPFDFMCYCGDNLDIRHENFEKYIEQLGQDFETMQGVSIGKRIGKLNQWLAQAKWNTGRVLNMTNMAQKIAAQWKIIFAIIFAVCVPFYQQILSFIKSLIQ